MAKTTKILELSAFSVLVIDDDERKHYTYDPKSNGGLRVDYAKDAKAARRKLTERFYNVVYCDFFLNPTLGKPYHPEADEFGTVVLDEVRKLYPSTRRVLTTSKIEDIVTADLKGKNSSRFGTYFTNFVNALRPTDGAPVAHYCVFLDQGRLKKDIDREMAEHIRRYPPMEIQLLYDASKDEEAEWYDAFSKGKFKRVEQPRAGELSEVLRRLFSTYKSPIAAERRGRDIEPLAVDRLEVSLLSSEGKSGAEVLRCSPFSGEHPGAECVVKIDDLQGVRKEAEGFDTFVKFYRSNTRRVEMLNWLELNQIGGLCYTFAGGASGNAVGLYKLFEKKDVRAIDCLHSNYHPGTQEWFSSFRPFDVSPPAGKSDEGDHLLSTFFTRTHFHRDEKEQHEYGHVIRTRLKEHVERFAFDHGLKDVTKLRYVRGEDVAHHLEIPYDSCIGHGDMNGGNMIVVPSRHSAVESTGGSTFDQWLGEHAGYAAAELRSSEQEAKRVRDARRDGTCLTPKLNMPQRLEGNQTIVIDYQFTMRGPIFIDFAALEASIRMSQTDLPGDIKEAEVKRWMKIEALAWDLAWRDDANDHVLACNNGITMAEARRNLDALGYWGAVSYELQKLARRNFEEVYWLEQAAGIYETDDDDIRLKRIYWERQYAATCMFFIARMLKSRAFQNNVERKGGGYEVEELPDRGIGAMRLAIWANHLQEVLSRKDITELPLTWTGAKPKIAGRAHG